MADETKKPVVKMEPKPEATDDATGREKKIAAFLDEFAPNDTKRRQLRDAIETGAAVEGGSKYFQSELKKIQGKAEGV